MTRLRIVLAALVVAALAFTLVACGSDDSSSASTESTAAATTSDVSCTMDQLKTLTAGTLTVGTDKPAFPPYVIDDDPTNGKGFESAVAYAVADQLGFTKDQVKWTVVPFNSTLRPGPEEVRLRHQPGLDQPGAPEGRGLLVAVLHDPAGRAGRRRLLAVGATTVTDLKDAPIGVQVGTTSLDAVNAVIKPSKEPRVFNDSNDVVRALKYNQVNAIVVDLPTAIYLRDAEVEGSEIVGQFAAPGGDDWGAGAGEGLAAHRLRSGAVDALTDSGQLKTITDEWIGAEAPVLDLQ